MRIEDIKNISAITQIQNMEEKLQVYFVFAITIVFEKLAQT